MPRPIPAIIIDIPIRRLLDNHLVTPRTRATIKIMLRRLMHNTNLIPDPLAPQNAQITIQRRILRRHLLQRIAIMFLAIILRVSGTGHIGEEARFGAADAQVAGQEAGVEAFHEGLEERDAGD